MASAGTDKEFYRLVRQQRKTQGSTTPFLAVKNKVLDTPEDISEGLAAYFQTLATPSNKEEYDDEAMEFVVKDFDHIINTCSLMDQEITPATLSEIRYAISRLKTNKTADYLDLTSDYLKYCGLCVETFLLNSVNYIFDTKQVSHVLKDGLVPPIYKKGEKTDPANYWGITVTSILQKVVEHIMNKRHNLILGESQSRLQNLKGFTAGSSSIDAALILS